MTFQMNYSGGSMMDAVGLLFQQNLNASLENLMN